MPKNDFDFDEEDDRPHKARRPRDEDGDDRPRKRAAAPSNGAATAALILGILALCTGIASIPAIILGFIGLAKAKTVGVGKGMAVTGLVLGALSLLVTVAATAALVYLLQTKDLANVVEDLKKGGTLTDRETTGKMRLIARATHTHQDTMARLPNNTTADDLPGAPWNPRRWQPNLPPNTKNAPPFPTFLRSWRVDLLPHLGEDQLYAQFKLDQPWDSAANKPHSDRRVEAYADSGASPDTRFRGLAGSGTVFEPYQRIHFAAIPDGTSGTILFVEATDTAKWAEGNDLRYDAGWPEPKTAPAIPAVGRPGSGTALVAMCDGSVRRISKSIDPMAFRRLAGRADGMVVEVPPVVD